MIGKKGIVMKETNILSDNYDGRIHYDELLLERDLDNMQHLA